MLYRNHTEMRNSLATFDVGRTIAALFILIVGAALINCNNAPIYAYARILLAPKVLGSSNSIHSDSENGIAKPFSQIHSRQTFQQQSDQLQLPQPNSSTGPSSLSLLSEFPPRMSQLPSESFSSASSSITSQASPTQQPILQQQQQPILQQQPNYRSWFPSLPASSCPGTFQLTIDGLAYLNSLHYQKNGLHQISLQITSVYGNNTVAGKMWIDKKTDKDSGIDFLVKDTYNNCQVVTSNSTLR
ncbi:MAG TPA: hypothetical protein VFI73_05300 [Candidatus Nitrosopolaris sp.]|nr:hypothetical protein [Candidatus Nitrosopolaris sp.]